MKKWICVIMVCGCLFHGSCFADDFFRCGPDLVSIGDSKFEVHGKCGEPTAKEVIGDRVRGGFASTTREGDKRDRGKSKTRGTYTESSVTVEAWTYNCGSSEFSYQLLFLGQELSEIRNLGYGFGASDCIGREHRVKR